MSQSLIGRLAIRARQLRPGEIFATEIHAGQLVEIMDMQGHQVAQFAAFALENPKERLSPAVTRTRNGSIVIREGMKLASNRGTELFELIEDTVGRHDLLAGWDLSAEEFSAQPDAALVMTAAQGTSDSDTLESEPRSVADASADETEGAEASATAASSEPAEEAPPASLDRAGPATDPTALAATTTTNDRADDGVASHTDQQRASDRSVSAALLPWGLTTDDLPDPVNWFMHQAILQRGELEVRRPLSERGDRVILRALADAIIVVRASNGLGLIGDDQPSDVMVRVFR